MPKSEPKYRCSGHESFPLRYAWLPKAFSLLDADPEGFKDLEEAMVHLGLGKNMVKALRFWVEVTGVAVPEDGALKLTEFARLILGPDGFDPFLEDERTLWLLHWKLSSHVEAPLFAWDFLLNKWPKPELSRSAVLTVFQRQAEQINRRLTERTLRNHLDIFIRSYVRSRGGRGSPEDTLDSPLIELRLLEPIGERVADLSTGRREVVYAFRRESKPEIPDSLFVFALREFWRDRHPNETTLSMEQILYGHGSPGQVFKLPDWAVRDRLARIGEASRGEFEYRESAALRQLIRTSDFSQESLFAVQLLEALYEQVPTHA